MVKYDDKLFESMRHAKKVAVLTGAGISAESGVPTFRGDQGLWRQYQPTQLATPEAFRADPKLVWEWYQWRRELIAKCQPNPAHYVLVEMEKLYPDFWLLTQNVDGLHNKAGNKRIVELHGNIWQARSVRDGTIIDFPLSACKELPPKNAQGDLLRPNVVWFGEALPAEAINMAFKISEEADLFFIIGTSAIVQPAASLPLIARQRGAFLVEVNLEPTPLSPYADVSYYGKAGEIMPDLWANFLKKL